MKLLMVTALLIELCWNMKMTIKITLLTKGVRYGVCCFAPRQQCFEWQLVGQLSNAEYTNCYIVHCISLHVLNVWMFWMTTHGPSLRRLVHAEYVNCDTVQCLALQCLQPISLGLQRTQTAIHCISLHVNRMFARLNVLNAILCNPFHSACNRVQTLGAPWQYVYL